MSHEDCAFRVQLVDFAHAISESVYLIINCPLTGETYHRIDKEEFDSMKSNIALINVARGAIINEQELIRDVKERRITAAGLDVFEKEPPERDNALLTMENVVLSLHVSRSLKRIA